MTVTVHGFVGGFVSQPIIDFFLRGGEGGLSDFCLFFDKEKTGVKHILTFLTKSE